MCIVIINVKTWYLGPSVYGGLIDNLSLCVLWWQVLNEQWCFEKTAVLLVLVPASITDIAFSTRCPLWIVVAQFLLPWYTSVQLLFGETISLSKMVACRVFQRFQLHVHFNGSEEAVVLFTSWVQDEHCMVSSFPYCSYSPLWFDGHIMIFENVDSSSTSITF